MGFWIFMLYNGFTDSVYNDRFRKNVFEKSTGSDQLCVWLQNINVNEESGHLGICTSLLRKDLVYLWTYSLVVSLIVLLLVMGKSNDAIGNVGGILCVFQMIPLVGSIIPTEIALRKNFDKYGNKR